jgi:hypothetical protein
MMDGPNLRSFYLYAKKRRACLLFPLSSTGAFQKFGKLWWRGATEAPRVVNDRAREPGLEQRCLQICSFLAGIGLFLNFSGFQTVEKAYAKVFQSLTKLQDAI